MKTFTQFLTMTAGVPALSDGTVRVLLDAYSDGRMAYGPLTVRRAVWFCRLAQSPEVSHTVRAQARQVLTSCALANGRDVGYVGSRQVVNRLGKASTVRLAYWAMDKGAIW